MNRKITVGFLTFLLLISSFAVVVGEFSIGPVSAISDSGYSYTVYNNAATITGYTGMGGAITIPPMLGGYTVNSIAGTLTLINAYPGHQGTFIWTGAFQGRSDLYSVTIPNSVTSIGNNVFQGCTGISSVTIPNSVTSIGNNVFQGCTGISSVTISSNITSINSGTFDSCIQLASVTIPGKVTSIGDGAFSSCTHLTSIAVNASNQNYASVDGVLYNKAINALILCPEQKAGTLAIPNSVTTIFDSAFLSCTALTSLNIGNGVTTIWNGTFSSCTSLTSMTIGSNVTSIGSSVFSPLYSLTSINVVPSNTNYASISGMLLDKAKTTLIQCPEGMIGTGVIPGGVTSIGRYAFNGSSLTNVTIPNSVTFIGDYAFENGTHLTSISIGNGVITIGKNVFLYCHHLNSIMFYGQVSPDNVGTNWLYGTNTGIKGHAYLSSNFPAPGSTYYGLLMGSNIPLVAPGVPTSLTVTPGKGQVSLTWQAPAGLITGYNVYRSTSEIGTYSLISSPWVLTYTDTNVTNGQTYFYQVSAVNSVGEGPESSGVSVTPLGMPTVPQNLQGTPGNGQVILTWSAPVSNGGASIDYYIVSQNGADVKHVNATSTTIDGLTNGQTYNFALTAHNSYGIGTLSTAISVTPSSVTLPGIPSNLVVTPGDGQVTLSWTAPSNAGGSAIDYYIVYQNGVDVSHPTTTSATIAGLTNGQNYIFTVGAHNSRGAGTQSSSQTISPKAGSSSNGATTSPGGNDNMIYLIGAAILVALVLVGIMFIVRRKRKI